MFPIKVFHYHILLLSILIRETKFWNVKKIGKQKMLRIDFLKLNYYKDSCLLACVYM